MQKKNGLSFAGVEIRKILTDPQIFNLLCKHFGVVSSSVDNLLNSESYLNSFQNLRIFDNGLKGNRAFDQIRAIIAEVISKCFGEPAYIWIKSNHANDYVAVAQILGTLGKMIGLENIPSNLSIFRGSWYLCVQMDWSWSADKNPIALNCVLSSAVFLDKPPDGAAKFVRGDTCEELMKKCIDWISTEWKRYCSILNSLSTFTLFFLF